MFFVGICDDNSSARKEVEQIVRGYCRETGEQVSFVHFSSGEAVIDYCRSSNDDKETIDILFLDIEMQGINGLDCKRLLEHENTIWRICFTTSYTDYVFDSFSTKTMGYLIKPLEEERMAQILKKVLTEKNKKQLVSYYDSEGSRRVIGQDEIRYIKAEGSYVSVKRDNADVSVNIIISKKLGQMEKELGGNSFGRCHKSYLVNFSFVETVGQQVIMNDLEQIPIGRAYRKTFISCYQNYIREMIVSRM